MSDLTKTIKLRIHVTPEQEVLFRQMTEQYRQACNFVSRYIFDNQFDLAYQNLNKQLYGDLRSLFGLKSQLAQSCIKRLPDTRRSNNSYSESLTDTRTRMATGNASLRLWNGSGNPCSFVARKPTWFAAGTIALSMTDKSCLSTRSAKEPDVPSKVNIWLDTLMVPINSVLPNWLS